jgi:hypothetical protein
MRKPASANSRKLSEALYQRLNVYAATAGAACAGMLAAQPVAAQVVYTPAHIVIEPGTSYFLYFAGFAASFHNRMSAMGNSLTASPFDGTATGYGTHASVEAYRSAQLPRALNRGVKIGGSQNFVGPDNRAHLMARASTHGDYGKFVNVKNRYLGLKIYHWFTGGGNYTNYGWARFTVRVKPNQEIEALLSGYAYESTPNTPIRAGQMSGTADDPVYAPEPEDPNDIPGVRSERDPISQAIPQAPLGLLALGAQGLPFWRPSAEAQQ